MRTPKGQVKAPPTFGHGGCPTVEVETGAVRQQLERLACSVSHAEKEMDQLKSALDSAVRTRPAADEVQQCEPLPPECELATAVRVAANRIDRISREIQELRSLLDL